MRKSAFQIPQPKSELDAFFYKLNMGFIGLWVWMLKSFLWVLFIVIVLKIHNHYFYKQCAAVNKRAKEERIRKEEESLKYLDQEKALRNWMERKN